MKSSRQSAGERMIASAREVLAFVKRKCDHGCHVQLPEEVDVRAITERIELSQSEFARLFGLSKRTLQHWEQGRRAPDAAGLRVERTRCDADPRDATFRAPSHTGIQEQAGGTLSGMEVHCLRYGAGRMLGVS